MADLVRNQKHRNVASAVSGAGGGERVIMHDDFVMNRVKFTGFAGSTTLLVP